MMRRSNDKEKKGENQSYLWVENWTHPWKDSLNYPQFLCESLVHHDSRRHENYQEVRGPGERARESPRRLEAPDLLWRQHTHKHQLRHSLPPRHHRPLHCAPASVSSPFNHSRSIHASQPLHWWCSLTTRGPSTPRSPYTGGVPWPRGVHPRLAALTLVVVFAWDVSCSHLSMTSSFLPFQTQLKIATPQKHRLAPS